MPEKGVVGGPQKNCASPRLERCEDCEPVYHLSTSFTEEDFTPTDFHSKWLSNAQWRTRLFYRFRKIVLLRCRKLHFFFILLIHTQRQRYPTSRAPSLLLWVSQPSPPPTARSLQISKNPEVLGLVKTPRKRFALTCSRMGVHWLF